MLQKLQTTMEEGKEAFLRGKEDEEGAVQEIKFNQLRRVTTSLPTTYMSSDTRLVQDGLPPFLADIHSPTGQLLHRNEVIRIPKGSAATRPLVSANGESSELNTKNIVIGIVGAVCAVMAVGIVACYCCMKK